MKNLLDGNKTKQQYEIIDQIGSGGFGQVYKAQDNVNNRTVAIKVFQKQLGQDDEAMTDWIREAEHALTFKSDHIIGSYEFVQPKDATSDDYYLVMEYADKGSLRKLIDEQKSKGGYFQDSVLLDVFRQMLMGLQEIHKTALHRDIKPENMLFVGDLLKLSDFGLAKYIDQATRTRTYKGWGTYIYMAPESWALGKMTPATDIYSLGIAMYEAATLQIPFTSSEPPFSTAYVKELEELHKYGDRPRAKSVNPQMSSKLDGIIYKMMMQSPTSRYQTADEILQELNQPSVSMPLSPTLQKAAALAQQLYAQKTQAETAQQRHHDQVVERTKMNRVKIKEFVAIVQKAVDNFNQAVPESKLLLSMGSAEDYTIIWDKTDLLRLRIQPFIEAIKLRGQPITAYVEVNFRVPARPNEGTCFVLCFDESNESDYGQWKVLENSYSPLMQSPGVYHLSAELSQLQHLHRQGNAIGQFQYDIVDNVVSELEDVINKAFEYHNQDLQGQKHQDSESDSFLSDDDDVGFGY